MASLWFGRAGVIFGYKCQAAVLIAEPSSLLHTDKADEHTDNATISQHTHEITARRPEKR